MSDLSGLSDAELTALYQKPPSTDLSQMSDADLMKAYQGTGLAEDAAKSIGSGLGNATIGTLGAVGDLRSLASRGVDALGSKLGFDSSTVKNAVSTVAGMTPSGAFINNAPTSQQVRSTITDPIVSPDYEPQSALGHVLKTGAEFLPGMADPELAGPAAFKAAAKLFASRVAAPALASEGAGALTKGTDAEPYARVVGALAGGAGASKLINSISEARAIKAAAPALADVKADATNSYDALTSRNVAIPLQQSTLDNLANDITTTLNNKGIRPSTAQSIHNAVAEIKSPATAGAADVADLVAARQSVKGLLSAPDANKAGAFVALNKIEQSIEQNSPGTMAKIREADKNYSAAKAVEALDKRTAKAELNAAGEHSGFNVGNKIRQQVKNLLNSSEAKYLSAETKADLEKVVRGTWTSNGVRAVSKLFGAGGGLGMVVGGAAGYEQGGIPGAIAAGVAGRGLGRLDAALTAGRASRAAQNIRLRSPLGQQTPLVLPPRTSTALSALLPALLARPHQ